MGMSLILVIAIIGLGVIVAIVGVVAVVFISRRDDFVNPFSKSSPMSQPTKNVSPEVPKNVPPHLYRHPETNRETAIVDWLVEEASAQTGMDLSRDTMVRERLTNAVRLAITDLETSDTAQLSLPFLAADEKGPKHFEFKITRQMLDQF